MGAMCYVQIGGLAGATFITLVPVIYSVCVLDLKIVRWEPATSPVIQPAEALAEPVTR